VEALCSLDQAVLEPGAVEATLGAVLKSREDLERVRDEGLFERIREARSAAARSG
jgi:hypothetical protein